MNIKQELHLNHILNEFYILCREKYIRGTKEHKGLLLDVKFEKILDNAIDEAIDQVTYLITMKQKLINKRRNKNGRYVRNNGKCV